MDVGLFVLRVTVGLTMGAHGAQKLFGWFGGYGLEATGRAFEGLGFRPGRRHALMAGLVELGGGLLFAAGLLTPLAAALVASVMVVAAVTAHVRNGFFITTGGYEYNLVLGLAALSVAFTGAGALSLDALLPVTLSGVGWGVASVVVAIVGAAGQLAQRRPAGVEQLNPA
jgi:putative oxidoreductase